MKLGKGIRDTDYHLTAGPLETWQPRHFTQYTHLGRVKNKEESVVKCRNSALMPFARRYRSRIHGETVQIYLQPAYIRPPSSYAISHETITTNHQAPSTGSSLTFKPNKSFGLQDPSSRAQPAENNWVEPHSNCSTAACPSCWTEVRCSLRLSTSNLCQT